MRTIEYQRWDPLASPLTVEFPSELLLELGWADASGVLYGSRRGKEVRVMTLNAPQGEEQEKVGVFFSRIRGEVFLTESDIAFLDQEMADLALVVAGRQAGFFVRQADGSLQAVRSHEEFSIAAQVSPFVPPVPVIPRSLTFAKLRGWLREAQAAPRALRLAAISLAAISAMGFGALAMRPQRPAPAASGSIRIQEVDHQLRISWTPVRNAVLTISDAGDTVSVPVFEDQSTATYVLHGSQVEVTLVSLDPDHRLRRANARYVSEKPVP